MAGIKRMKFVIPATKIDQARLALIKADENLEEEDNLYKVLDWYDFQDDEIGDGDLLLFNCSRYYERARASLEIIAPFAKDGSHVWMIDLNKRGENVHKLLYVKDGKIDEIVVGPDDIFKIMIRKAKGMEEKD